MLQRPRPSPREHQEQRHTHEGNEIQRQEQHKLRNLAEAERAIHGLLCGWTEGFDRV